MSKMKQAFRWIPEILLIIEILFYWLSSSLLNPIAIILLAVLLVVPIFKKKTFAFVVAIILLLLNFFMCLALLSELDQFPTWSLNARLMLLVGGIMLGTGILASIAMIIKWGRLHSSIMLTSN